MKQILLTILLTGCLLSLVSAKTHLEGRVMTFEERVDVQEMIERFYDAQRIWPEENPGLKPAFEERVTRNDLEKKVREYLLKSAALEEFWRKPLIAEQLQAEMDRMAAQTKAPNTLRELFASLGNDPVLIAECVARPALADRLIRSWYSHDLRFHGKRKKDAERLRDRLTPGNISLLGGNRYQPILLEVGEAGLPSVKRQHDHEKIILAKEDFAQVIREFPAQGLISEVRETGESYIIRWTKLRSETKLEGGEIIIQKRPFQEWLQELALRFVPSEFELVPVGPYRLLTVETLPEPLSGEAWKTLWYVPEPRYTHTTVWTGSEMIVWGGINHLEMNRGGRYNPATDTWSTVSTGNDCPSSRRYHTAVWTGSEMIVWGGYDGEDYFNTGGRYNPGTDSWNSTYNGPGCPTVRGRHTAIWTGSVMIIWGGERKIGLMSTDGCYDPNIDMWSSTSIGVHCPSARRHHTAIWTGYTMMIWGGEDGGSYFNTGGRYDPNWDQWSTISTGSNCPSVRAAHTSAWAGNEMFVWGGLGQNDYLNTGGCYNPTTDTWRNTPTDNNCPHRRDFSSSIWTGNEIIVWGGFYEDAYTVEYFNVGGCYHPFTNTWTVTSTGNNCPEGSALHTAIWTGSEMIVWGGLNRISSTLSTGGRYDPVTGIWTAIANGLDSPGPRSHHTAVWTGNEMIVWGGEDWSLKPFNTGGCYNPATDLWTATAVSPDCPKYRTDHTAVWTGSHMIVWGGDYCTLNEQAYVNSGGKYDPWTDQWIATSTGTDCPSNRHNHTALWTGNEMIVWGGYVAGYPEIYFNTGGRYNPTTDQWTATSTGANCPSRRENHSAIWTGTEMIIWGGFYVMYYLNTGGRYNTVTDQWTETSTGTGCPSIRNHHTAIWTGNEMIVWGGYDDLTQINTGGCYNPVSDQWTATPTGTSCLSYRHCHTAVWTGDEILYWGGWGESYLNTGGMYNPSTGLWMPLSTGENCPTPRMSHTAIWTGNAMIVWDGYPTSQNGAIYYPDGMPAVPALFYPGSILLFTLLSLLLWRNHRKILLN